MSECAMMEEYSVASFGFACGRIRLGQAMSQVHVSVNLK
jgi:hypothetical protein